MMKANDIFFKVDKVGNKNYQFNKKEDSESLKTEQNIQDISGFFIKKKNEDEDIILQNRIMQIPNYQISIYENKNNRKKSKYKLNNIFFILIRKDEIFSWSKRKIK